MSGARTPPSLAVAAWIIGCKDLAIEVRTRTAFFSALIFAVLALVIFRFAWDASAVTPIDLAPGVLWVIFIFTGLLALHRSFSSELADRAIDGLVASPVAREAIYLGKAGANLVFIVGVQAVTLPAAALFYDLPLGRGALAVAGVALLAAVGFVAVGTLFSAMTANTRLAELLLPVLALPFFVPIILPAAQSTAKLLAGRPLGEVWPWLKVIVAFDLVFVSACTVAFPYTLEE
ncbi:MAG: heme exporter protein CcmB [Gemmatimonadaceae bacterium]